ncbi:uncharacterized protein LOC122504118 [Leptopilina heterotoma]|uniref:uncharacterized protein LOC122504118 n=1 Tax=Leptopilina heterotoma TaxID=63436 RepID=UPI001CA9CA16|nr:uncharacterized protein LOC122504118 [Leptopilina heterotoma]XP_043470969.1 uncharacterized protein LOC122504118 [Leptopilina heterotoma]
MSPEKFTTNNLSIMLKIIIICLVISEIKSNNIEELRREDIEKLREAFYESSDYIGREIKDGNGNAVVVLGRGRSGKSTLVNYLMGNHLIAYKDDESFLIKKYNESDVGPKIGAGSLSVTKNISKYNSKVFPGLSIWDAAGFQDNRGAVTEIENSFYLHHLVKKAEFLKIILVVYHNDIKDDNIDSFRLLLRMLESLFHSRFNEFYPSISFVLSRIPPMINNFSVGYDYINYKLNTTILSNIGTLDISTASEQFIKYLVEHNDHTAIFKTMLTAGNVTADIDLNVISSINNTYRIKKICRENVGFTISDKSKISLGYIKTELKAKKNFVDLRTITDQYFNEVIEKVGKERQNTSYLEIIKQHFSETEKHLNASLNNLNIQDQIEAVKNLNNSIKEYIEKEDVLNKSILVKFIDSLLHRNETDLFVFSKTTVLNAQANILQLINYCSLLQQELQIDEYKINLNHVKDLYNVALRRFQETEVNLESESEKKFWNEFWKKFPAAIKNNETTPSTI